MPKPPRIPYADKIVHFGFYFSYTTFFVLSFGKETRWIQPIKKVYLWALVTALLLGATMEILQGHSQCRPYRYAFQCIWHNCCSIIYSKI